MDNIENVTGKQTSFFDLWDQSEPIAAIVEHRQQKGEPKLSAEEAFERFHRLNPHVYELIKKIAFEMKAMGKNNCSIWMIFGMLRWKYFFQTRGETLLLNNNHTSFYSRKLQRENPGLDGFLKIRKSKNHNDGGPQIKPHLVPVEEEGEDWDGEPGE